MTFASPMSFFSPEIDKAFRAFAVTRALNSYTSQSEESKNLDRVKPYEYAPSTAQAELGSILLTHSRAFEKPLKSVLNSLNLPLM